MLEADERFLERLRIEIEPIVGPRTALGAVGLERDHDAGPVRLVVELVGPTGTFEVKADGETLVEAIGALPARIAEARLAASFREVVQRTTF